VYQVGVEATAADPGISTPIKSPSDDDGDDVVDGIGDVFAGLTPVVSTACVNGCGSLTCCGTDTISPYCTDITTDVNNCGGCGNDCTVIHGSSDYTCIASECVLNTSGDNVVNNVPKTVIVTPPSSGKVGVSVKTVVPPSMKKKRRPHAKR
jgi:hypothetical protein